MAKPSPCLSRRVRGTELIALPAYLVEESGLGPHPKCSKSESYALEVLQLLSLSVSDIEQPLNEMLDSLIAVGLAVVGLEGTNSRAFGDRTEVGAKGREERQSGSKIWADNSGVCVGNGWD
ncbi:unnamed protein product [Cuscuta campestris]|uniref:Uncharacterized protein n=1 Tax=Cuscuta campestris TaxID=132261 RepID=A0A484MZK1_9ASTE|nr:unnamed protein product [Cuscuta campestris]